jgi:hypothetical protein
MQVHTARAAYDAAGRPSAVATVFNWLKRKLEARRARLNHARDIAYLRSLDRHMLEDMGVDIASLGEARPKLESVNPHVVAIQAICPPPHTSNSR